MKVLQVLPAEVSESDGNTILTWRAANGPEGFDGYSMLTLYGLQRRRTVESTIYNNYHVARTEILQQIEKLFHGEYE